MYFISVGNSHHLQYHRAPQKERVLVLTYTVCLISGVCKVCQTALGAAEVEQGNSNSFDLAVTHWVSLGQA